MRKILIVTPLLLLAGCASSSDGHPQLGYWLENPLFTERYAEAMVDAMVELDIQKNPILEDAAMKEIVDETRRKWLEEANTARKLQREGPLGNFIPADEFAKGEALYLKNVLYFGTTFEAIPGPSVKVYLTQTVDPRDVKFPDPTAVDLGMLLSPFGAQRYAVPHAEEPDLYRTVVLYDTKLDRIHGFAQISK